MYSLTFLFMCRYTFKHNSITACYTYICNLHIVNVTHEHRHTGFKAMDELVFWDRVGPSSGNWYLICKTKACDMPKIKPCVL